MISGNGIEEQADASSSTPSLNLRSQTGRGTAQLVVRITVVNIIAFAFFGAITRMLPQSDIGLYSAVVMVSQILVIIFSFGMSTTSARMVSAGAEYGARGTINVFHRVAFVGGLLSGAACFLLSETIALHIFNAPESLTLIRVLSFDVFALTIITVSSGIVLGLMKYRELLIVTVFYYIVRSAIGLLLVYSGFGLLGIVIGWVMGDTLGALLMVAIPLQARISDATSVPLVPLMSYAAPIYVSEILMVTATFTDRMLVLLLIGKEALAVYHTVLLVFYPIVMLSKAFSNALLPAMSRVSTMGLGRLRSAGLAASRYVFILFIPLSFALAAFAQPVLELVGGPAYVQGSTALILISVTSAMLASVVILELLIKGTMKVVPIFVAYLLALVVQGLTGFLLIPYVGIMGAALSRVLLNVTLFLVLLATNHRRGTLLVDRAAFIKILFASLVGWASVIVTSAMFGGIMHLVVGGLTFSLVVGVTMRLQNLLRGEDYLLIDAILPRPIVNILKFVLGCAPDLSGGDTE